MVDKLTVEEVEAAANTLEKVSRLYEYENPSLGEWCAADLRVELDAIKASIEDEEKLEKIATVVIETIVNTWGTTEKQINSGIGEVVDAVKNALREEIGDLL